MVLRIVATVMALVMIASEGEAQQQIREVPLWNLPDIAMAAYDQWGPVIYYNPLIVQRVGPEMSVFFRAHEYAHHQLDHVRREFFEANPYNRAWVRQQYEREADCRAAELLPAKVITVAVGFFAKIQGPTRPDWYHPTGYERASVIQECANP